MFKLPKIIRKVRFALVVALLLTTTFLPLASAIDLTITVGNMVPVAGSNVETQFLAGATITRGQSVYLDAATSTWKLADVDLSASAAGLTAIGISLSDVVATQPMIVQKEGDLAFGAILTVGKVYVVSATAGGICPIADITTNGRITVLGIATTTSNLKIKTWVTGVVVP
jgi:hypothetical protein